MGLEPCGAGVSRAVGPQVKRPMGRPIHQHGAVCTPTPPCPIVHPAAGGCHHRWGWPRSDETTQGIRAGGHMELEAQPCPGFATTRRTDLPQRPGQAHGTLRRGPHHLRDAFGTRLRRAGGIRAANATDAQDQTHHLLPPRKIAWPPRVVAMPTPCGDPAARATSRGRSGRGGEREPMVALAHGDALAPRQGTGKSRWPQGCTPNTGESEARRAMISRSLPPASHFCPSTTAAGEPKNWTTPQAHSTGGSHQ
jgi:hypothetical protein